MRAMLNNRMHVYTAEQEAYCVIRIRTTQILFAQIVKYFW
jgi:hypothetical protein